VYTPRALAETDLAEPDRLVARDAFFARNTEIKDNN